MNDYVYNDNGRTRSLEQETVNNPGRITRQIQLCYVKITLCPGPALINERISLILNENVEFMVCSFSNNLFIIGKRKLSVQCSPLHLLSILHYSCLTKRLTKHQGKLG